MCNISLTVNTVNTFQNNLNSVSIVNFPPQITLYV